MSGFIDNFISGFGQSYAARVKSYQEQTKSLYRREEVSLGAMYALEREQFKANSNRDLVYLKNNHALDIENRRANLALELEEKKSILSRWIEEFRGGRAKEIEELRQDGRLAIQEREHVHNRLIIELEQAEERYKQDNEYERSLEINKQKDKLQVFQKQREIVYSLELKRFESILSDRESFTNQFLQEFSARHELAKTQSEIIGGMMQNNLQTNNKMNEMILAAVIAKVTSSQDKKSEQASKDAVGRVLDGWKGEI